MKIPYIDKISSIDFDYMFTIKEVEDFVNKINTIINPIFCSKCNEIINDDCFIFPTNDNYKFYCKKHSFLIYKKGIKIISKETKEKLIL